MAFNVVEFAKSHPVETGVGVFVVGFGALYVLGFFGGGNSAASAAASQNALAQAYLGAQTAQNAQGAAVQIAQIQGQNATAQALIGANASVVNNTTWANADLAQTQSNNQAAAAVAPYSVYNNLIQTLGQVASLPPTTTTQTKSSSGFFGIGGGSKTTTTVTPNAAANAAGAELASLWGNLPSIGSSGFNAGS